MFLFQRLENTEKIIEMCLEEETDLEEAENQMANGKVKPTFKSLFIAIRSNFLVLSKCFWKKTNSFIEI